MLFVRDFAVFTGGHLKVFHYFRHVSRSGRVLPQIFMTQQSLRNESNPWIASGITESRLSAHANSYFLGGLDWDLLDAAGIVPSGQPVINLIQHVRHCDREDPRYRFLSRPAIRVCVSPEVASAISSTGCVNGPVICIPNGIDLEELNALRNLPKRHDAFIGGLKNQTIALQICDGLKTAGLDVDICTEHIPRWEYLRRIAAARIAILLPNATEGFFLPAIEAMGLGTAVIVPDSIGNRSFCRHEFSCIMPPYHAESMIDAARQLAADPQWQIQLSAGGLTMAVKYGLDAEYDRFISLLDAVFD